MSRHNEIEFVRTPVPLETCVENLQTWQEDLHEYSQKNFPDKPGQKHQEIWKEKRRVAAAANRYGGFIIVGARHHDSMMRMQMSAIGYERLWEFAGGRDGEEQGFIDQWGFFMDRKEAYDVAEASGQIINPEASSGRTLFSECYL